MNRYGRPFSATAALLLAAVAIIGYLAGNSESTSASRATLLTLSAGNVVLEYPSNWQRTSAVPAIPGLALAKATALAPRGDGAQAGLLVGQLPEGEPGPLPESFVAQLDQLPDAEVVDLIEIQAYKYAQPGIRGFNRKLTVYAIPNPDGGGTVLACYAPARSSGYMRACQQIVATAILSGQPQLYRLTPEPAFARELGAALGALDARRVALRRELDTRATPATAQRLAAGLAEAFASAGTSLSALEPLPATHQAQAMLSDSLSRAREAYDALAAAAADKSTARFAVARTQVYEAEASVSSALERFALLGYQQR